jgi:hypothetical protein
MANQLVFQEFHLFRRASRDSGLDACLRRHDDVENGSWTAVRESGNPEQISANSCTCGYVLWIPACVHWCPGTVLNIVMPAEAGIQAGISTDTLEKAKHLEHQKVSH